MLALRTIHVASLAGVRVVLRADLDVPVSDGQIAPGMVRLDAAVRTIRMLQSAGARVVVIGHRGRPTGPDPQLSLEPVARALIARLPAGTAQFVSLSDYTQLVARTHAMAQGDVCLLENVRFHAGEQAGDVLFAKQLAALGDVYINDAFGNCHRDHASMTGITQFLDSYAGPTILQELQALERIRLAQIHPYVAIVGGKKISSKLHALTRLLEQADDVWVGGAIATTCFVARGLGVGASLFVAEDVPLAERLLASKALRLPVDVVVVDAQQRYRTCAPEAMTLEESIVDIGPETIQQIRKRLLGAKMVLWNGPVGIVERRESRVGSDALVHLVAEVARGTTYGVVGGGDTVALLEELGVADFVDHVSTGGGAMLEYVGGQTLPALAVLMVEPYVG